MDNKLLQCELARWACGCAFQETRRAAEGGENSWWNDLGGSAMSYEVSELRIPTLARGRMNFAAATPSDPPIKVSQALAAKTDMEASPLTASVTISVNAYAPHATS
jgi:hypothetical protein